MVINTCAGYVVANGEVAVGMLREALIKKSTRLYDTIIFYTA